MLFRSLRARTISNDRRRVDGQRWEKDEKENQLSKETDFIEEAFLEIEKNLTIFGKPRYFRDPGKKTLKITDRIGFESKSLGFWPNWNSLFKKQEMEGRVSGRFVARGKNELSCSYCLILTFDPRV